MSPTAVCTNILPALLCLLCVVACNSLPVVQMRNPRTGETAKCGSGPYDSRFQGGTAHVWQRECIEDFQRQGWERVPDQ